MDIFAGDAPPHFLTSAVSEAPSVQTATSEDGRQQTTGNRDPVKDMGGKIPVSTVKASPVQTVEAADWQVKSGARR